MKLTLAILSASALLSGIALTHVARTSDANDAAQSAQDTSHAHRAHAEHVGDVNAIGTADLLAGSNLRAHADVAEGGDAPARASAPRGASKSAPLPRSEYDRAEAMLDQLSRRTDLPLTPEMIDQTLAIASEIDPALAQRLQTLCGDDPQQFETILRTTGRRLVAMAELKDRAPELYELKLSEWRQEAEISRITRDLADAHRRHDSLRVQMLENELRTQVMLQVALQLKARRDYLQKLQQHLEALEREVEQEIMNFERTVEQRIEAALLRIERMSQGE